VIPEHLPDYVDRGGRQVWRPPYDARHADLFGFVVQGDRDSIDALLRHDLVEPAGGAVDLRCASPLVVVAFATIDRLTSADPRDKLRGFLSEREVSVWCLAADALTGGRLLWYMPYVFVDSGQASASGREVFGYPKQMGVFADDFPNRLVDGGTTRVEALAINPYGEDQPAVLRTMVTAQRQSGDAVIGGGDVALGELTDRLSEGLRVEDAAYGPGPTPSAAITPIDAAPPPPRREPVPRWAVRRVLDTLQGRGGVPADATGLVGDLVDLPTLVFLKQFRDVACPTKACYQAVIEAPLSISGVPEDIEQLDPSLFAIAVEDWDSHPIASDLGIAPGQGHAPFFAFRAKFDFQIQLGLEVWRAST
jgi:hypothetical protein